MNNALVNEHRLFVEFRCVLCTSVSTMDLQSYCELWSSFVCICCVFSLHCSCAQYAWWWKKGENCWWNGISIYGFSHFITFVMLMWVVKFTHFVLSCTVCVCMRKNDLQSNSIIVYCLFGCRLCYCVVEKSQASVLLQWWKNAVCVRWTCIYMIIAALNLRWGCKIKSMK